MQLAKTRADRHGGVSQELGAFFRRSLLPSFSSEAVLGKGEVSDGTQNDGDERGGAVKAVGCREKQKNPASPES